MQSSPSEPQNEASQLGAVILAGGESKRLPNKCFRLLGDKELILHVFHRISEVTQRIVFAVRDKEQAERVRQLLPGAQLRLDDTLGQGPLVGFLSGIRGVGAPYVLAVACDAAFVKPDVIRLLFRRAAGKKAAVPVDGKGLVEPLCAVYHRESALRAGQMSLETGDMSMRGMLKRLEDFVQVPMDEFRKFDPDLLSFKNINTLEDLGWATQLVRPRGRD